MKKTGGEAAVFNSLSLRAVIGHTYILSSAHFRKECPIADKDADKVGNYYIYIQWQPQ